MKRILFSLAALTAAATVSAAAMTAARVSAQQLVRPNLAGVGTTPSTAGSGPESPIFDDSVLQDIGLTISPKDWQSLQDHYLDNTYYPCDFRWRNIVVRNIGIRSRGTGSRSGVKPGLRVDFNRYVTDQTFLGLKSLVLRNNTQDASGMHETVSMLLFRRMGLPASRESHATMSINNAYAGLYSIVESVDKSFLQRQFGEDDGYLFKYDYPATGGAYFFEDRGSDPTQYVPLPFKPETYDTTDPRPEYVVQLVQTINQTSDANFTSAMAAYLDLKKVARHVAVEHFIADNDGFTSDYGGMNNYYINRFNNRTLFALIAWDKSEAFKGGKDYSVMRNMLDGPFRGRNVLMNRMLAVPDVYNAYLDALIECANSAVQTTPGVTGGWMENEIQREYAQIRDAARADPQKSFTNDQFEAEVTAMLDFARNRSANVTQQVAGWRH
jgi:spore coat protein CotH